MNRRKGLVGLTMLCLLVLGAVPASSAFAAKGTTAFTCLKVEKEAQFSDAHCTTGGIGTGYKHEAVPAGTKTAFLISNQKTQGGTTEPTTAIIRIRIGPMDGDIQCKTVSGEGSLTGNAGPPMNLTGSVTIAFGECTLVAPGTFPECVLASPTITTLPLNITTPTEGMKLSFAGETGTFAKFSLTKCKNPPFNTEYVITGGFDALPSGTTLETTAETSLGLKTTGGQAALISKTTLTRVGVEAGTSFTTTEN